MRVRSLLLVVAGERTRRCLCIADTWLTRTASRVEEMRSLMTKLPLSSGIRRKQPYCARTICVALAVLITSLVSAAAPAQTLDQIATTTGVRANGESAYVDVMLTNNSPRTVTAWAWTVEGPYADGSIRSHSGTVDALADLLAVQRWRTARWACSLPAKPTIWGRPHARARLSYRESLHVRLRWRTSEMLSGERELCRPWCPM